MTLVTKVRDVLDSACYEFKCKDDEVIKLRFLKPEEAVRLPCLPVFSFCGFLCGEVTKRSLQKGS